MSETTTIPAPVPAATFVAPAEPVHTPTPAPPQTPAAPVEPRDEGDAALQDRFEAQRQVNRDLETKFNALRNGLRSALGVEEPKDGGDLLTTLQQQVADMRHDTLVERVARSHGITDDNDVAVLREVKDEALMQRLAERLKTPPGPTAPAPDQGQGARPTTPQAEADAEYAKYFPA